MKLRNGFVSNSSSSSYIISIPKVLTVDQLFKMIQFEVIGYRGVDYARGEETIDSEAEVLESMFRVKKGLEENDIKIEEKAGRIEISCYTLMHNDYSDMPNIMKSIYFALLENLPGNVIFRRQDD